MSASADIRTLYAWICDTINGCAPLRDILDVDGGVRRMQWGMEDPWQNVLTYGRATRRRHTPGLHRPIYSMTVTFAPWIRGEAAAATMGDLILADIEHHLVRIFDLGRPSPDSCDELIILDSRYDDFSTEPAFNDEAQAWTQQHRYGFDIVVPSCLPVLDSCEMPCP